MIEKKLNEVARAIFDTEKSAQASGSSVHWLAK
jgi:hypothetical protein